MKILSNDPSMTAWGWVVIGADGKIYAKGCIKTESNKKKLNIRKGDDTTRRISEITRELLLIIHQNDVKYILGELPHGSQNASAAVMIGAVTGLLQALADTLNIGLEWYSEADSKKALLNKRSATKQEIQTQITRLYNVSWTKVKYKDEAIADAIAVFHAAKQQSPVLRFESFKSKSK